MSEVPFYQTRAGRRFYEATVPELVRQIARLNDLLAVIVQSLEQPDPRESSKGETDGHP